MEERAGVGCTVRVGCVGGVGGAAPTRGVSLLFVHPR